MNKLIMKEDEDILSFFRTLDHMVERLDGLSRNYRPMLNGERFLSDRELSERLKISRRTLQEYRNEGKLPYIQLRGKVLYKESDIERMLQNGYKEAWQAGQMP
ncbi:helix-turn-helix domain-containing protein [Parabacteroides merdae]|uniref:helix-turn-helix domain-containing protein n=1 Tax=Parabacteroides merdae TaxID=46503 RepID=UPI0034A10EB1